MWEGMRTVSNSWVYLVKCWGWRRLWCTRECGRRCLLGCLGVIKIGVRLRAGTALRLEKKEEAMLLDRLQ